MCISPGRKQFGVSLLELVIAIAIIGIALAGVLSVFILTTQHSADPMARLQAQIIAEGYLEEILLKQFYDPTTDKVCPGGAGAHAAYVCGYNGLSESIAGYTVAVSVAHAGVTLGTLSNPSNAITTVIRVDVTVNGPNSTSVTLSGYRTNYECPIAGGGNCKPAT